MANILLALIILSSWLMHSATGDPRVELVYKSCGDDRAQNVSEFNDNYAKVILSMQEDMLRNKFAIGEEGNPPNRVYVLAQCMDDLSNDDCMICFSSIRTQLPGCFPQHGGSIFFDGCFLRVDNYSFFNEFSSLADQVRCSDAQDIKSQQFNSATIQMINSLAAKAPLAHGYAVGDGLRYNDAVYGMANCWRTLDHSSCEKCLSNASTAILHCLPSSEARVLNVGCYLRYSDSEFANHPSSSSSKDAVFVYLALVLGAVAICLLAIMIGYLSGISIYRRHLKSAKKLKGLEMESIMRSFQFKYSTLEKATENFSVACKIGQGGFGEVFKGTLPDGREIAIKRLFFTTSKIRNKDISNEIDIIGEIQHQNLVRFLGCCFTNDDRFLIYEFMPNRSLDLILFDPQKRKELDWRRRFGIIKGMAEGLEYLHKNCEVQIVHRDIKASNILLDQKYRPKIADFGLARFSSGDQGSPTLAIEGTFGYMAPEYVAGGWLSDKVDVYSYGVLVLEIVSGMQNNKFLAEDTLDTLVTTTWRHFKANTLPDIIDASMEIEHFVDILRVVQIALLCTQELPEIRPDMTAVIQMLSEKELELPIPSQPPFLEEPFTDLHSLESSHQLHYSASTEKILQQAVPL